MRELRDMVAVGSTILGIAVVLFLIIFGTLQWASPHTYHVHDAQHCDSVTEAATPETAPGSCYIVTSYDEVSYGFLWLRTREENKFTGTYYLKK